MNTRSERSTDPAIHIPGVLNALAHHGITHRIIPAQSPEDSRLTEWTQRTFPTVHSQVDWTRVAHHKCVEWWELEDLVLSFQKLADMLNPTTDVVVMWANALNPCVEMRLGDVAKIAWAIFEEHETSRDVLVFSQADGWLIEMFHEGTLCFGRSGSENR